MKTSKQVQKRCIHLRDECILCSKERYTCNCGRFDPTSKDTDYTVDLLCHLNRLDQICPHCSFRFIYIFS